MFWYLRGLRENTHSFKEMIKNTAQQFRNWIKLDAAAIFKLSLNQIWISATEALAWLSSYNHAIDLPSPLPFLFGHWRLLKVSELQGKNNSLVTTTPTWI